MKQTFMHLLLFVSLCSFLLCFVTCKNSPEETFKTLGGLRIWVGMDEAYQLPDNGSEEIRKQLTDAMRERIEYYGVTPNIQWLEKEKCILVEIPGVKEPECVLNLLRSNANLEFREAFDLSDIYSQLIVADERLAQLSDSGKEKNADSTPEASVPEKDDSLSYGAYEHMHPLFAKLQINSYQTNEGSALASGPVIGYAKVDDMAQVTEYLTMDEIQSVLPSNLVFRWGGEPIKEDIYELYAVREIMPNETVLDGSFIKEAKADPDYQGNNAITLQMDEEGTRMWARMTKDNIGKYIAILVDDKVYSAPRVNDQITGGRSMITGEFSKEESQDLVNILNSGRMPVPIRIIRHEMVTPDVK